MYGTCAKLGLQDLLDFQPSLAQAGAGNDGAGDGREKKLLSFHHRIDPDSWAHDSFFDCLIEYLIEY